MFRAGVFLFLLFGRGACFCFCCLGGGREFAHLPVCLARLEGTQQQQRPNNKKKTRVPYLCSSGPQFCINGMGGVSVQMIKLAQTFFMQGARFCTGYAEALCLGSLGP